MSKKKIIIMICEDFTQSEITMLKDGLEKNKNDFNFDFIILSKRVEFLGREEIKILLDKLGD